MQISAGGALGEDLSEDLNLDVYRECAREGRGEYSKSRVKRRGRDRRSRLIFSRRVRQRERE